MQGRKKMEGRKRGGEEVRLVQLESVCLNLRVDACVCVCKAAASWLWCRGPGAVQRWQAYVERCESAATSTSLSLRPSALPSELNSRTLPHSAPFVPTRHPSWMRISVLLALFKQPKPSPPSSRSTAFRAAGRTLDQLIHMSRGVNLLTVEVGPSVLTYSSTLFKIFFFFRFKRRTADILRGPTSTL